MRSCCRGSRGRRPRRAALLDALSCAGVDCGNILVVAPTETLRSGHSVIFSDPHGVRSRLNFHDAAGEVLRVRSDAVERVERIG